jgi:hypothetical protein
MNASGEQLKRVQDYGEDANRLALALDKAEAGSDLERQIIREFLFRFAAQERLDEAKWWEELQTHGVNDCQGRCGMHKRIAAMKQPVHP